MTTKSIGFGLGRVLQHDSRSLEYPAPTTLAVKSKNWRRYGTVLDQGRVGSCTGNATAQALNHTPFHVIGSLCLHEDSAVWFYSKATVLDGFPGTYPPDDTGSSGLAVSKVAQDFGYITSYDHAFGLDHVLSAAMYGPLIVGTNWYEDMFNPDLNGVVYPTGSVVGGHEYVLNGVDITNKKLRFLNSWTADWGVNGHFFISFDDFSKLLNEGGDAILFRS